MEEAKAKRQRTCVGCGSKSDKLDYLRIVRTKTGDVAFDETGRVAGRGAYVCSVKCFEDAYKSRKLQRALRTNVGQDTAEAIARDLAAMSADGAMRR